jgi:hypothetical protein
MYRLLIGAVLASSAFAQQEYFPLEVGNQWIYRVGGSFDGGTHVVEVTSTRTVSQREYFVVTGFPGNPLLLRKTDEGTLVFFNEEDNQEHTWVAFQAATGEAFRSEIDDCSPVAVIRSKTARLQSPLGQFDSALEVGYAPGRCADAGLIRESFLPNVGLAQRRESNIAGEQVWDLIYARLGFTVIGEKELSFSGSLDAPSYKPGTTMTVRMTVRSTQEQPLRLNFPSSQDYDVVIRNEAGETVYVWSSTRSFLGESRTVEVAGEKNWALTVRAPAVGRYTATLKLAVQGRPYETTVPFDVQ